MDYNIFENETTLSPKHSYFPDELNSAIWFSFSTNELYKMFQKCYK